MRWNRIGNLKAEYYRYRLTNALRNPLALENEGVVEITTMLGRNHTRDTIEKNRLAHLGKRHSNETKVKLSLAKLGKNNPRGMLGKHHSEEVKQKMRLLRIGKKMSEETKLKIRLSHLGEKNGIWKGDNVGYHGLHSWINRIRPKPTSGLCEICNNKRLRDAANITGIYNRNFENWKYACSSCHVKLDITNGTRPSSIRRFGIPHSKSTILRIKLAWESRRYAKMHFMSGIFRIPEQKWMKRFF